MHAREQTSFRGVNEIVRQHSTTSFSENFVVAKTVYEMLEVSSFCYPAGKGLTTFNINHCANFAREKAVNGGFWGFAFCSIGGKNFKSDLVLVVVLVLESKGLYSRRLSNCLENTHARKYFSQFALILRLFAIKYVLNCFLTSI